jgi:hypothetical protein
VKELLGRIVNIWLLINPALPKNKYLVGRNQTPTVNRELLVVGDTKDAAPSRAEPLLEAYKIRIIYVSKLNDPRLQRSLKESNGKHLPKEEMFGPLAFNDISFLIT